MAYLWGIYFANIQKYASDHPPHIHGKNMNTHLDKIWPQMLQNKANSAVWGPYLCSYFWLVCGGWGCKKNPQIWGVGVVRIVFNHDS